MQDATIETTGFIQRVAALARWALVRLGALFPPSAAPCDVVTHARLAAPAAEAWRRIVFYEDVPHSPPVLLRLLLPVPLRTSKPALAPGALVQCSYSGGGRLVKRITEVRPCALVRFDVIEQQLGIEPCFTTVAGSYALREADGGTDVALTTTYRGHLRPRWLWRAPERWLAHALHRHILSGMGATFDVPSSARDA